MSSIRLTPKEYAEFTLIMLFESIRENTPELDQSEEYRRFIQRLQEFGSFKPFLYQSYITMDAQTRIKYNMFKKVFNGESEGTSMIMIVPERKSVTTKAVDVVKNVVKYVKKRLTEEGEIIEEECDGIPFDHEHKELCKKIYRKIKEVRFAKSMPMTEDRIDKIIDFVVEQERKKKKE